MIRRKMAISAPAKSSLNMRPDPRAAGDFQIILMRRRSRYRARCAASKRSASTWRPCAPPLSSKRRKLLNASQDDPLGPWREAGGKHPFDALELVGPLRTTGTGEGSLPIQRRSMDVLFCRSGARARPHRHRQRPECERDARRAWPSCGWLRRFRQRHHARSQRQ